MWKTLFWVNQNFLDTVQPNKMQKSDAEADYKSTEVLLT